MGLLKQIVCILGVFLPWSIRAWTWRLLGFKVGKHCNVKLLTLVYADQIEMGPGVVIEPLTLIYKPRRLILEEGVRVASFVRIVGWKGDVHLKRQSFVGIGTIIDLSNGFQLGERSQVGPRNTIYTHGISQLLFSTRLPERIGAVVIGRDSYVGMGCLIYPKVEIGDEVLIFPGMRILENIASRQALVPTNNDYTFQPIRRFQLLTTISDQRKTLDTYFAQFGDLFGKGPIDRSNDDIWKLKLKGRGQILYVRNEAVEIEGNLLQPAKKIVIWTLLPLNKHEHIPQFCFSKLLVYGPETRFGRKIALDLQGRMAQFAFDITVNKCN